MPHYAILVADSALEHARAQLRGHAHAPRRVGFEHAHAASECPAGRPNCRNCGDPAHAAACQAAGHCPDCGTKHGIAPDAVLAANGYALKAVAGPAD